MDFSKLSNVGEVKMPITKPAGGSNPIKDSLTPKEEPTQKNKPQVKVMDAEELLKQDRITRRRYLAHLSDSERRKMFAQMRKIKDAENSTEEETKFLTELSDNLTTYLIDFIGKEKLEEALNSVFLSKEEKDVVKWVISLDPLPPTELSERAAPLKEKFKKFGVEIPPFVFLTDSINELLNASPKIQDDAPLDDALTKEPEDQTPTEPTPDDSNTNSSEDIEDDSLEDYPSLDEFNSLKGAEGTVSKESWTSNGYSEPLFDIIDVNSNNSITEDEFKKFLESNEPELTQEGSPAEPDSKEDGDALDSSNKPTFEDYRQVVHAVEQFMNTGDKSVFANIAVSDSITKLMDAWDDNGNYILSKEETDKILEDVKNDLEEKGVKIAKDSLTFNTFEHQFPKIQAFKAPIQAPLTNLEFHQLNDAAMHKTIMTVAALLDSENPIPFNASQIVDGVLELSTQKLKQTWVVKDSVYPSETITRQWVKDNCISSNNYCKVASALGYVSMLDSRFYKKRPQDSYETDPMTCNEACRSSLVVPPEVESLVKDLGDKKIILKIVEEKPENQLCCPLSNAEVPSEGYCVIAEC